MDIEPHFDLEKTCPGLHEAASNFRGKSIVVGCLLNNHLQLFCREGGEHTWDNDCWFADICSANPVERCFNDIVANHCRVTEIACSLLEIRKPDFIEQGPKRRCRRRR